MSSDVFRPLSAAARREGLLRYAEFLAERDGAPDFARRSLARREEQTRRFETERLHDSELEDRDRVRRAYLRFDPKNPPSDAITVLLALVKVNASEAYGVEKTLAGIDLAGLNGPEGIVLIEEHYHTRILLSAAAAFGHDLNEPYQPDPGMRALIGALTYLPRPVSQTLTYAAEALGVLTFLRTLRAIDRVLADRPAVRDALAERVTEVLIDEVGHVSYHHLLRGPIGTRAAASMMTGVAKSTGRSNPEMLHLGILPVPLDEVAAFRWSVLPEEVRSRAFVV
jgi:hypothetical protein